MSYSRLIAAALLFAATAGSGLTQDKPQQTEAEQKVSISPFTGQPETPEKRMARLGTQEDPGPDPPQGKIYIRFGKEYTIEKFSNQWAKYDLDKGFVRPRADVNIGYEIYQEDAENIWVWRPILKLDPMEETLLSGPYRVYNDEQLTYLENFRQEFNEVTPAQSDTTVRFEESSHGLPKTGSFRNSLAAADMNGDGHLDLIVPAQRGSMDSTPMIFLGDSKGTWNFWNEASFPRAADYGGIAAADLNRDGHMDLALAVHLQGVLAFLGNGKGHFVDASSGLATNFPTRRVAVQDLNNDRLPDIIAINEGPRPYQKSTDPPIDSKLKVFLNQGGGKSWKTVNVAEQHHLLGGDWLAVANLNGDRYPDIVTSSIYFNGPDVVYLSSGPGKWTAAGRGLLPFYSLYFATAAGPFTSKKTDDVVIGFNRYWPSDVNPYHAVWPDFREMAGLELLSFRGKKPTRSVIAAWPSNKSVWGMASADFNGDKNRDVIYAHADVREFVILLGNGKGGFSRARLEGLDAPPNTTYDITVADVNRDGRPDVLALFEAKEDLIKRDGSIRVWLNRGTKSGPVQAAKSKSN